MPRSTEIRLEGAAEPQSLARVQVSNNPTLSLSDERSKDPSLVGAKAAALATATQLGLPVLPGFAIVTNSVAELLESGEFGSHEVVALRRAWDHISEFGTRAVVVRSSSVAEDGTASSMAGLFVSLTEVEGFEDFLSAVETVARSSETVSPMGRAPMGVLVQPRLDAKLGGVMFGVDPVTGADDRIVVAAVEGTPEGLVSGRVQGSRYTLKKNGRVVEATSGEGGATLGGARRRALAGLALQAEGTFGQPQDVEWAIDRSGRLWLLQSRPVTAVEEKVETTGPLLGPGPVAETFPGQLSMLEEDLWVEPLKTAITEALILVRTQARKRIHGSPVLVTVGGRVAVDLELLGSGRKRNLWQRIDPRPPTRRLIASWDVGRLRSALPSLVSRIIDSVDAELAQVPPLSEMTDVGLVDLLKRARQTLVSLNGHEILAGMIMSTNAESPTGASLGLSALNRGRAEGLDDDAIVARYPEVLALSPPRIGSKPVLPEIAVAPPSPSTTPAPLAESRELCRMRARWLHELTGRVAMEIGRRFASVGVLQDETDVKLLRISEIEEMIINDTFPPQLDRRGVAPPSPPLPAAFRLSTDGRVVAEESASDSAGRGAGGGRGKGRVVHDPDIAQSGDVLVVRTLDPGLATVLPGLGGLIAETGSVLSHLAILAREFGVPTVVGVSAGRARFRAGDVVVLDGTSGSIELLEEIETLR